MTTRMELPGDLVDDVVTRALQEDLGLAGDLTSAAIFDDDATVTARLVARQDLTVAGLDIAARVFSHVDPSIATTLHVVDGTEVAASTVLATVAGPTRGILGGERVALNFLGRLSGIATLTSRMVALTAGTNARVADTRKTTPTLRALEKYAVRMGGGSNHRFGLFDAVMVKDNHIAAAGGITAAVTAVRSRVGHTVTIEVEVDDLDQLPELLEVGADVVLLDNMGIDELRRAVAVVDGAMVVEASGGITAATIADVAATGVDVISLGALTHSAANADVALDVVAD
ncbi:MAG TPA: carboxylating nicotinate-nucleotide diphosphorylase [Nitriliruptoraceae bacterium]|nr:carboxylating nicotinate-nucleotide diphosphorylase [Nitriliruptoraceae bacterium]